MVGIFVDGKNVALDANGNVISINGPFFSGTSLIKESNTQFDGTTPRLTVDVALAESVTEHTLTIVVCDAGDGDLDTAVMLASLVACDGTNCGGGGGPAVTSWCGDGKLDVGELCDDGNKQGGDGCSATCALEAPAAVCGNGKVEAGEAGAMASAALVVPSAAQAADYQLDAQLFTPSAFFHDGFSTPRGQTDGGYPWSLGLVLDYQKNPVVLRRDKAESSEVLQSLVSHQVTANVMGSVRLMRWLSLGVAVPIIPLQAGNAIGPFAEPASFALGDVRLTPRLRLLTLADGKAHVAGTLGITLPTGKLFDRYTGRSGATVAPGLAGDVQLGDWTFTGGAAVVLASADQVANISISQRIDMRGAAI